VPEVYFLETNIKETAHLAETLVRAEVIPAGVYQPGQSLIAFFNVAFEARLKNLSLHQSRVEVTLRCADESANDIEALYFTVNLQPVYFDLSGLVQKLDSLNPALAPALVQHIQAAAEKVAPVFEGGCCVETVEWLVWGGGEEELLERAREDLAYARRVHPEALEEEELLAFAESHYLTRKHVNERLELRFQQGSELSLDELQQHFVNHQCSNLEHLCERLKLLRDIELPESQEQAFYDRGDFYPFGLVLGLPKNQGDDLVAEMFGELEQYVWNAGDWAPAYALEIALGNEASLERLALGIEGVLKALVLVTEVVNLLVEASQ
jgi:hypothetical protein